MAYLDIAGHFSTAQLPAPAVLETASQGAAAGFSAREWKVIELARKDGLSSLREESEFKEFLRLVFGFERSRPLANPRLEALRRIAVLSWHHSYNVAASELDAFYAAGFSIDQYDAMLAHIGRERAASARRSRR